MDSAGQILKTFFDVLAEIVSAIFEVLPKALSFFFWVLSAIFILPCVFISGAIYPKWEKWGEDF